MYSYRAIALGSSEPHALGKLGRLHRGNPPLCTSGRLLFVGYPVAVAITFTAWYDRNIARARRTVRTDLPRKLLRRETEGRSGSRGVGLSFGVGGGKRGDGEGVAFCSHPSSPTPLSRSVSWACSEAEIVQVPRLAACASCWASRPELCIAAGYTTSS